MNIWTDLNALKKLKEYFCNYREDSLYNLLLESAKKLCNDMDGDTNLKTNNAVRKRKKSKMFQYKHDDEGPQSPEEVFKIVMFSNMYIEATRITYQ